MVTFLELKLGQEQVQGFMQWKSVAWELSFKGPAMQRHAIEWHECGVSRVDAQGESVCSGVTIAVKTVHVIGDRIVI